MKLHLTEAAAKILPVNVAMKAVLSGYTLTVNGNELNDAVHEGIRGTCEGTLVVHADGTADLEV